jgi:Methyltransferase domain
MSDERPIWLKLKLKLKLKIFNALFRADMENTNKYGDFYRFDYPIDPKVRYGFGKPPLGWMADYLAGHLPSMSAFDAAMLANADEVAAVLANDPGDPMLPQWRNPWFSGLDALALMTMLKVHRPKRYIEVGSGFSTKFTRFTCRRHDLPTTITSIDPMPRAEIDKLCDRVIRAPLETVDLTTFDVLEAGDILFIDNSHRVFQNSDVNVFFMEVLPRIKPGVFIHIHDIFWPYDYPPQWLKRLYSEQYVLGAYLLGVGKGVDVMAASAALYGDEQRNAPFEGLWSKLGVSDWQRQRHIGVSHDASFWMRKLPVGS